MSADMDILARIEADLAGMPSETVNEAEDVAAMQRAIFDNLPGIDRVTWADPNTGEEVHSIERDTLAAEVEANGDEGAVDLDEEAATPDAPAEPGDATEQEAAEPEPPSISERLLALGVPEADIPGLVADPLRNDPYYGVVMVDLTDESDVTLWLNELKAQLPPVGLTEEEAEAELRRAIIDDQMNTSQGIQGVNNWNPERRRAQQEAIFAESALEFAAKVREYFAGYLVFPANLRDAQLDVMTLWAIHTYCFRIQGVTPYLAVTAPTQGSGKTTVLELLSTVASNPSKVEVNPTAPVVRLMADEGRTVFLDEIDVLASDKTFTGVMNSGYKAGGSITRIRRVKGGDGVESSSTFCPKAVAGIAREGSLPLETATLDRMIEIKIVRAKPGELTKRFRVDVMREETEVLALRDWMQHWANKMRKELRDAYAEVPRLSTARAEQIWETLVTIGHLLGGDWYDRICAAAVLMDGGRDQNMDPNAALVSDVAAVVEAYVDMIPGASQIKIDDLMSLRNVMVGRKLRDKLTAEQVSKRLGAFGIRPEVLDMDGTDAQVYTLTDEGGNLLPHWVDLFSRYGE